MPMLPSRLYVSDHMLFIRDLMEKKPDLPKQQAEGRRIFWDKTPEQVGERATMDEGNVPQPAYVYQTK
ncbi:MAG: DUF3460 family protein [Betaproteobacteria bacterium]